MKSTVRSIAKETGVSPATVSRVFSGSARVSPQVRTQVLNTARRLGYHDSGMRNIAVIVQGASFYGYDSMVLDELMKELRHRNFRGLVVPSSNLSILDECVISGAISIVYTSGLEKIWNRSRAIPLVCINTMGYHIDGVYKVTSDDSMGIELAMNCFHQHGHRRIGLITYTNNPQLSRSYFLRRETFHHFLRAHGCSGLAVNMITPGRAADAVRQLLDAGVTAIFAAGESIGLPAAHALSLFKCRIPDDISLISYENSNVSEYLDPPHTTVGQRMDRLAAAAVELIEKQLNGEHDLADVTVDYFLRMRDSVAAPPETVEN